MFSIHPYRQDCIFINCTWFHLPFSFFIFLKRSFTQSVMEKTPNLSYTSTDAIPKISSSLRTTFASQKTKPIEWRLVQLRKLYWAYASLMSPIFQIELTLNARLKDNAELINQACQKDLGKGAFETYLTELGWCTNDVIFVCNNLKSWARDEKAPDVPLMNKALSPKIRKDPLGCCLIIG